MYLGEILSQLTRIIIRRFLYSEAATFIRFLAFLNLKRQKRTADVTVVVAKSLLPCFFSLFRPSLREKDQGQHDACPVFPTVSLSGTNSADLRIYKYEEGLCDFSTER